MDARPPLRVKYSLKHLSCPFGTATLFLVEAGDNKNHRYAIHIYHNRTGKTEIVEFTAPTDYAAIDQLYILMAKMEMDALEAR